MISVVSPSATCVSCISVYRASARPRFAASPLNPRFTISARSARVVAITAGNFIVRISRARIRNVSSGSCRRDCWDHSLLRDIVSNITITKTSSSHPAGARVIFATHIRQKARSFADKFSSFSITAWNIPC